MLSENPTVYIYSIVDKDSFQRPDYSLRKNKRRSESGQHAFTVTQNYKFVFTDHMFDVLHVTV